MARILVKDDDLVVRLSWRETAAAHRGSVRVPLAAVSRVTVEPDWWRALRGVALHGVWIPGVLCAGTRGPGRTGLRGGPARRARDVRRTAPTAPFRLLAVSVRDDAEATAERLRGSVPGIEASTPWRQPLPVAEEAEASRREWRKSAKNGKALR
ncbi:hypothetical protein [Streptomyces tailanensis]|uniref:hypothetical protein n=1 Tax=Streptomyces tailanensis TaxID=2569858 RepID=UPI001C0E8F7B|nr:hypothetical protein [Streptomyces tailanensis]